ncbi:hypothetical protein CAOG_03016 [Capsaspora owczarzaki ATCC 30864]|uniref:Uncharacterized protein n=1 Tax=Capsaspora owczarzaki (strain ATCC 30864) TaxID=595528 RepID=A0A0D2WNJ0_CAPO3|nr:hypothetical protein CAOG_03016 [Capsaspora owczarzaki ATCC 30864]KJE91973.1 hypothetical protein CAOG_003016 [Capsaspora owczarzaki ATCC 30864]|eukprot:XP_004363855.2 hypothetical protein CAOG_03016 [Capsaspora owczarzaki ATCC 30864]
MWRACCGMPTTFVPEQRPKLLTVQDLMDWAKHNMQLHPNMRDALGTLEQAANAISVTTLLEPKQLRVSEMRRVPVAELRAAAVLEAIETLERTCRAKLTDKYTSQSDKEAFSSAAGFFNYAHQLLAHIPQ